jgi:excisionase family DNA binding protein
MPARLGLSPREAAAALGVSPVQIRAAIRRGDLKCARVGVKSVVTTDDLFAWLALQPPRGLTRADDCTPVVA